MLHYDQQITSVKILRKTLFRENKTTVYLFYLVGEDVLVVAGIPDDIKDKILQPFFTTKKGIQGTGLGLSITNDIKKAYDGRMDINSTPGEKTTFTIYL